MSPAGDAETVIDHTARHRFEADIEGYKPHLLYRRDGERMVLMHTRCQTSWRDGGSAASWSRPLSTQPSPRIFRVVPLCPFAGSWLRKHPEVASRARIDSPETDRAGPPERSRADES